MGFFDLFRQPDINQGVEEYRAVPQAILLDVRTPEEYGGGHVPGSRNLPLQQIENITAIAEKKETPRFVYCQSGARSRHAVSLLQRMGYENVNDIGGMAAYRGEVE